MEASGTALKDLTNRLVGPALGIPVDHLGPLAQVHIYAILKKSLHNYMIRKYSRNPYNYLNLNAFK
jgi:hypothetical protein